jgi:GH15 family glucan-1,4-alpha-glucosidase
MPSKIENYALIGDGRTCALVEKHGAIEWLCVPRFDSDACFAALLGREEHGQWALRPVAPVGAVKRRYRPDTLILETEITCDAGVVRLIDFMPRGGRQLIVRIVEGVAGEVPMYFDLAARFGYGLDLPWIRPDDGGLELTAGPHGLRLEGSVPFEVNLAHVRAGFSVRPGQRMTFSLAPHPSHEPAKKGVDPVALLSETESWWRAWTGRCTYTGRWRDQVVRSLITLKALTYEPTGAIVAAATASLPEELGGVRNWDYRFCWVRDASLTLNALMLGGYGEDAQAFRDWLLRAAAGDPAQMQIMYGIAGERRLSELELDWLPGYEGSRPVRIGNAAHQQFQLDVYGELMNTIWQAFNDGTFPGSGVGVQPAEELMTFLESVWQRTDEGIWEVRGAGDQQFTQSKVMAWVAVDRAIKLAERGFGNGRWRQHLPRWSVLRDEIHRDVIEHAFDAQLGAFTQSYGSKALDASVLQIPQQGFLPANDPRMLGTVRAIERGLLRDGLVRRYATEHSVDGLTGDEGVFLPCSFWLADNYAFQGRLDEAEALFDRLVSFENDLGLLSEEYDPSRKRLLGNFPQAFTHLALVNTASVIDTESRRREVGAEPSPAAPQ